VSKDWWLGTPGFMQRLKPPRRDVGFTPGQLTADHVSADNTRTVDRLGRPKHTFVLDYEWISPDEADVIDGLFHAGRQPLVLLHPEWRNLATANASTGTAATRTIDGFEQTLGSLSSAPITATPVPNVPRLERAVSWVLGTGVAGQSLSHPEPTIITARGIPILLGFQYTASLYAALTAGSASCQARAEIRWYSAAGALVSTSQGSLSTLSAAPGWTRVQVTAQPPATAQWCAAAVQTPTNLGSASTMLATGWQPEYGPSATTWTHGRGVPRVWFADASGSIPLTQRRSASWTLLEL
jgi:hypothetical protein